MKKVLLAAACAAAALASVSTAEARGGCGRAFHPGYHGRCRPNRNRYVVAPGLTVGLFYPGRGYWDGRRYWRHRERWHGGWRYR